MLSNKKYSQINNINLNKILNSSSESNNSITDTSSSKKYSVINLNNKKINNLRNLLETTEDYNIGGNISDNVSATSSIMPDNVSDNVSDTSSIMPDNIGNVSDTSLEKLEPIINMSETEEELQQDTEKLLDLLKKALV